VQSKRARLPMHIPPEAHSLHTAFNQIVTNHSSRQREVSFSNAESPRKHPGHSANQKRMKKRRSQNYAVHQL
jgi:hypothetical protein